MTLRVDTSGKWAAQEVMLKTSHLASNPIADLPATLSLSSVSRESVDVRALELVAADGRSVLLNGYFTDGPTRWFFASDYRFLAWNVDNLYLYWRIEHGWIGLLLAVVLVAWAHRKALQSGTTLGLGVASALTGFLLLGVFASPVDDPRIALLYFFVIGLGFVRVTELEPRPEPKRHRRKRRATSVRALFNAGIEVDTPVRRSRGKPPPSPGGDGQGGASSA